MSKRRKTARFEKARFLGRWAVCIAPALAIVMMGLPRRAWVHDLGSWHPYFPFVETPVWSFDVHGPGIYGLVGVYIWLVPITMFLLGLLLCARPDAARIVTPLAVATTTLVAVAAATRSVGVVGGTISHLWSSMPLSARESLLALVTLMLVGFISEPVLVAAWPHARKKAPGASRAIKAWLFEPITFKTKSAPAIAVPIKVESTVVSIPTHPPSSLFKASVLKLPSSAHTQSTAKTLTATALEGKATLNLVKILPGPTTTRYRYAPKVPLAKVESLAKEFAFRLGLEEGQGVSMIPVSGSAHLDIEIPNPEPSEMCLRDFFDKVKPSKTGVTVPLGYNQAGNPEAGDLVEFVHCLVGGTTGSGKSNLLDSWLCAILKNYTSDHIRLLLIDVKRVGFGPYEGIGMLLEPVLTDPAKAIDALKSLRVEVDRRYNLLLEARCDKLAQYNSKNPKKAMPYIAVFIDEASEMIDEAGKEFESALISLAARARAAGVIIVCATQHPVIEVISTKLKANLPTAIALRVKDAAKSRVIIGEGGAEALPCRGALICKPMIGSEIRAQAARVTTKERDAVIAWHLQHAPATAATRIAKPLHLSITTHPDKPRIERPPTIDAVPKGSYPTLDDDTEALLLAARAWLETQEDASTASLGKGISKARTVAARLMPICESRGWVGPQIGNKPRRVLISKVAA